MCFFYLISPGWPESDDVLAQMVVSRNIQYMNMHHGVPISSVWSLRAVGIITISKASTIPILNSGGLKCFFQGNSFIFNPSAKLFNQGWLDINRSDSHIRVLIEPWRNGVSTIHLAGKRLKRAYAESCASPSCAHHFLTSIWLPWFQVWPVYSLAGDFCQRPTLIQYLLPSVSVPPAVHIWSPPILECLRQASTASGSPNIRRHVRPTALVPSWYWNLPHRWHH